MKKSIGVLVGAGTGFLNGLFGAGGGMVLLPALKLGGLKGQTAHATCLAIIFPLSLLSGWLYLDGGFVSLADAWVLMPGAVLGAAAGGLLLPKLSTLWLRRIFGGMAIFAACRLAF